MDQATCDIASGMATGWKPEIVEQHKAISLLHTVVAFLTSAAAFANQLGIIHPQQGMALAILIKLKDYWGALLEAVTWYNLGTISFEAVECDPGLKDPMLPGEHPELLASTVSEIMRSMTAGLILTGQPENMRGLDLREKRENIQMPEGYGGVDGMLDMGPSTLRHRGDQDKYATVTIKRAEHDGEGIILELGQVPASPMISHRVATPGVYGTSRTPADRDMPHMGPPDGSRVSFGRHFKRVNPGFARRRMVGIVREVTDEFVQVVKATASRLYMATVGKTEASESIGLDEEVKKYYKADELKDLVAWKGKYQDLELDELEATTDGSKASELVGKLIRRIAMMAGEVERYKWATDRLKTQLMEEEKANKEGKTSDATMADASTSREDIIKDRDEWREKATVARENVERLKIISQENWEKYETAQQKVIDLCQRNEQMSEQIEKMRKDAASELKSDALARAEMQAANNQEIRELKTKIAELEANNSTLRENGAWLKDQLNEKEKGTESSVVEELKAEKKEQEDRVERFKKEWHIAVMAKEKTLEDLKAIEAAYQIEIADMKSNYAKAINTRDLEGKQREELLELKNREVERLTADMEKLSVEATDNERKLRRNLKQAQEKIKKLAEIGDDDDDDSRNEAIKASREAEEKAIAEADALEDENTGLKREMEKLRAKIIELEKMRQEYEEGRKTIGDMRDKLTAAEQKILELESAERVAQAKSTTEGAKAVAKAAPATYAEKVSQDNKQTSSDTQDGPAAAARSGATGTADHTGTPGRPSSAPAGGTGNQENNDQETRGRTAQRGGPREDEEKTRSPPVKKATEEEISRVGAVEQYAKGKDNRPSDITVGGEPRLRTTEFQKNLEPKRVMEYMGFSGRPLEGLAASHMRPNERNNIASSEEAQQRVMDESFKFIRGSRNEIFEATPLIMVERNARIVMKQNTAGMAAANRQILLRGYTASSEDVGPGRWGDFVDFTVDDNGEKVKLERGVVKEIPPIVEATEVITQYPDLHEAFNTVISPFALKLREAMTYDPVQATENLVVPWTGASMRELGIDSDIARVGVTYPNMVYEEMARLVAEIAAWGSEEYPNDIRERCQFRNKVKTQMMDAAKMHSPTLFEDKTFYEAFAGARIPWEVVRTELEARSTYPMRPNDEYRVAYLAQKYGVEIEGKVGKGSDDQLRISEIYSIRPTGEMRRPKDKEIISRLAGGPAEGKLWMKVAPGSLPETAYMVMSDEFWAFCARRGTIYPEAGHFNIVLDIWHRDSGENVLNAFDVALIPHWTKYSAEPTPLKDIPQIVYAHERTPQWLTDDLRQAAYRGRKIGIAVDVRAYALMGGEVFLTRRGRLTVTTPIVQAFWKAVWFEETFTAIYMREFEIDVPPRAGGDAEYEPTLNKIMKDVVRVGWDRATRYEEVVNMLKPELTACPCCLVNTTKGVTFCVECAKPIPSLSDYYRGMMFSHETGMPIQGRKMGWKVHMERKIRDLHKDVKWRLVTDRLDIMDKKVVAGIIASANPAEDWWLAFRIGASPEAEIIVSQPGVYRLELEDAATHAMILDIELARAIMDVMNYRDRAIDEATGGDVTSFKVMYSHPIMTSIAAARMRFIKYRQGV